MNISLDREKLKAWASELVKDIKTELGLQCSIQRAGESDRRNHALRRCAMQDKNGIAGRQLRTQRDAFIQMRHEEVMATFFCQEPALPCSRRR